MGKHSSLRHLASWRSFQPSRKFLVRRLMIAVILACILGVGLWAALLSPIRWSGQHDPIRITIAPGISAQNIAKDLEKAGLIRSSTAFSLLGRITGQSSRMKAGVYDITPRESAREILRRLNEGDTVDLAVTVTIPEGLTVKQIAQVLEAREIVSAEAFLEHAKVAPLPYDFLAADTDKLEPERRLEGYLYPDSYRLVPSSTPQEVVRVMTSRFRQVANSTLPAEVLAGERVTVGSVSLSLHEIVTLASIVEREAVLNDERPVIAGVFLNRLRIGQPLQSCATVQYILEKVKPILSTADTKISSPYNTYQRAGLTPGPIAVPGAKSLQAVINPTATNYFYFYAMPDGSGRHIFSRTLDEHNQAIRRNPPR